MRFFSNILLRTDRGKNIPAGEEFKILRQGPVIPGVQGNPPIGLLEVSHLSAFKRNGVHDAFNVYSSMGSTFPYDARIRYPALLGLSCALGYRVDLIKLNGASLEKQEMQLLSYRSMTKYPLKVTSVTAEAANAYARGDSMEYNFLTAYENALTALSEMFKSFQ